MSLRQLLREPLTHFFVLAAAFFLVEQIASAARKTPIVVDQQTASYLIQQREDLELRALSADERAETIAAFIEDEILYNEAYQRGLDRGDSRMRRNLILKMRGLLVGELEEPTEEDLRRYFEDNRERFTQPASMDLEQVYFENPASVPPDLLTELNDGLDPASAGLDSFQQRRRLPNMAQNDIVEFFGPESARTIVAIDDARWHGPLDSPAGVHFIRVTGRTAERAAGYESVQQYLRGDWLMRESRRLVRAEVERLRPDYEIVVETDS